MKHLSTGKGKLASDLVPTTHAELAAYRLFFPFEGENKTLRAWGKGGGVSAATTWFEMLQDEGRDPADYWAAVGDVDGPTAELLRTIIGNLTLTALFWPGYGDVWPEMERNRVKPDYTAQTPSNGLVQFVSRTVTAADFVAGMHVPEFAWDDAGTLAWGAQLYPDSLVVAVAPPLIPRLLSSDLFTAVRVNGDEVMPGSAGD